MPERMKPEELELAWRRLGDAWMPLAAHFGVSVLNDHPYYPPPPLTAARVESMQLELGAAMALSSPVDHRLLSLQVLLYYAHGQLNAIERELSAGQEPDPLASAAATAVFEELRARLGRFNPSND